LNENFDERKGPNLARKLSRAPSVSQITEVKEDFDERKAPNLARKLSKTPSVAQIREVTEDFDEKFGNRGADVRKFSKQFTASERSLQELQEDLDELVGKNVPSPKKRGKKLSITPSVAAIVEEFGEEEEDEDCFEVVESRDPRDEQTGEKYEPLLRKSKQNETAANAMATAAEQLLMSEMKQSDQDKLASLLGETRVYSRQIAAEQTVGNYIRDNSSQTGGEIYPIKELIKVANSLRQAEADIKGKQDVVNASIRSTYSQSIAKSSHSIYSRTNATLNRMEKYYKKSVENNRRAMRQELDNIVSKLRDEYIEYYEGELKKRLSQTTKNIDYSSAGGDLGLQEQLTALMQENEQLRKQLEFNSTPQVIVDTSAADKANAQNKKLQGEMSKIQKELENAQVELSMMRQEKEKLEKQQKKLEATIKAEQEQNKKLQAQIHELDNKLREQEKFYKGELKKMEMKYENQIAEMQTKYETQLRQQKENFETEIKSLKEKALEQINQLESEKQKLEAKVGKLGAQLGKMSDSMQKANAEREKAMARANQAENTVKSAEDSSNAASGDTLKLENELAAARQELIRADRNWERRFAVLRASLHEIKDEAYVRKRIEVLPMALHTAKVEYRSKSTNSSNPNFPIRDGRVNKQRRQLNMADIQRELHAFSPVGSDTFQDEDESSDDDQADDTDVRYIVAPKDSEPRIASAKN